MIHSILFYKYHPLSNDATVMNVYRLAFCNLCSNLQIQHGRLLIGCSDRTEGINGTLAGTYDNLTAFTYALLYNKKDNIDLLHLLQTTKQEQEQQHCKMTCAGDDNTITKTTNENEEVGMIQKQAIEQFWEESSSFFTSIGQEELRMDTPDDFKWSSIPISKNSMRVNNRSDTITELEQNDGNMDANVGDIHDDAAIVSLFPDLNIKLVSELINTGGILTQIPIEDTSVGYLSPQEWHHQLASYSSNEQSSPSPNNSNQNVLILDCRNNKEYQVGHFQNAMQPNVTTFASFIQWVHNNQPLLSWQQPNIYMYCTGGIRCEKASAYIRQRIPSLRNNIYHLKGGIHKYIEMYGHDDCNSQSTTSLWMGRNFVFDGRDALSASPNVDHTMIDATTGAKDCANKNAIIGRCLYCHDLYDRFDPHSVCTVCREPILVCPLCQVKHAEYHCMNHIHLHTCYFTHLHTYTIEELHQQFDELLHHLDQIAIGRRYKQKRKTIQKQMNRLQDRIQEIQSNVITMTPKKGDATETRKCRNCTDIGCDGRCWGFYGLKRKERLMTTNQQSLSSDISLNRDSRTQRGNVLLDQQQQQQLVIKKQRRDDLISELIQLNVVLPPSTFRNVVTSIRVPPCVTRILQCTMKAKWCGQSILKVIQNEFVELTKLDVLNDVISHRLLRLNGQPILLRDLTSISLKGSDVLGRIVHWHEAPVIVPPTIDVERRMVPSVVLDAYGAANDACDDDGLIYVCNKPSSVPTHPAGPYLANSLTMMVEGQENLPPQSLHPLHRTDRVTSGLTLCSTSVAASRAFHKSLTEGTVDKLYLAKVYGSFPSTSAEVTNISKNMKHTIGLCDWSNINMFVIVDAPIFTSDPAAGVRTVDSLGKPSKSYFQRLFYDPKNNTSIVSCCPITGRNHQLRVHLQWLGFPVMNDVLYSGARCEIDVPLGRIEECAAVDAMVEIRDTTNILNNNEERRVATLSDSDVIAAKQACPCCRGGGKEGILKSFTRAQLLLEGHSIYLHAFRYRVRIQAPRKTKQAPSSDDSSSIAELSFQVNPPTWANEIALESVLWLTEIVK